MTTNSHKSKPHRAIQEARTKPPEPRTGPPTKIVYFSFCHPEVNPGGAQAIAKRLFDAHQSHSGKGSALFIAASIGSGPQRSAGSNLIQVGEFEFIYVCPDFDYIYFTNHDAIGQRELLDLVRSFEPDVLHFHHFMGFGIDFLHAALELIAARTVFTVHEHMLVCHNDGHLVQNKNNRICSTTHSARCATCMPEYRYDYFQHRLQHFESIIDRFDHVTAVSQFTANVIQDSMKLRNRIQVIPNGPIVEPKPATAGVQSNSNKLKIAYIGQVHRTKGVHLLMEAVHLAVQSDPALASRLSLDIWGPVVHGDYQNTLDSYSNLLKEASVPVGFRGIYDSTNLKNVLAGANIVVVPSMWPESYCLTADEAIALGKILICADFPAARERFMESSSVHFVAPGSSDAIAGVIHHLAENMEAVTSPTLYFSFASFGDIYEKYTEYYK